MPRSPAAIRLWKAVHDKSMIDKDKNSSGRFPARTFNMEAP